jgi:hypothetical protein
MRLQARTRVRVRRRAFAAWFSIFLVASVTSCTPLLPSPDVVIGTGSPGGAYYPLGGSICRLFNLEGSREGLRCAVVPSAGPIANLAMLRDGRIDIGIMQSDILVDAVAGVGASDSVGPNPDLRMLFTGHSDAFTIVARRELGIRSAAELRGKRINMGSPGSGERVGMERILTALGASRADFAEVYELNRAEQHRALCANELDAIIYEVAHPNGLIQDVVRSCRGVLIDLSGQAIDDMLRSHPEYERAVIPGGTYLSNSNDVRTIGVRAVVVVTTQMTDALAYKVTKDVFDNFADFRHLHPAFSGLSIPQMVDAAGHAPLHPGAARYYRERGWLR